MKTLDGEEIVGWTSFSVFTRNSIGSIRLYRQYGAYNAWGF